jgi:error-prone DNA polymerase
MTLLRERLRRDGIAAAVDLKQLPIYRPVRTAGVVIIRQRPMTAKGFMFITMEDETGFSNIVVRPDIFARFKKTVVRSRALVVTGYLEKRDAVVNMIAHHLEPLTLDGEQIRLKSRDFR